MQSKTYSSWGNHPYYPQTPHLCHWRDDIDKRLLQLKTTHKTTLPFGNGRSYGDSCLAASNQVLHTRAMDRFISADWQNGMVIVESGMTIEQLLSVSIPRGWFLPVTPGTQFVTLGGALANDVHGKNHHKRGTFGCHVSCFGLVRSDQGNLICSREENSELFQATIGGLGLTGIISWMEIKLIPIQSTQIDTLRIRFNSIQEFFDLSAELDNQHEYSVSWIDCLAKGKSLGRGVFTAGDHALKGKLDIKNQRKISILFTSPVSAINNLSLKLLNTIYYQSHGAGRQKKTTYYDPFFYPLDRILNWNKMYGIKGFQQYQCIIPNGAAEPAIQELLQTIAAAKTGSFLAVLKRCGDMRSPGWMSFPMPGISLALDFPQNNENNRLFYKLDQIVREAAGRLYPAKDAHMRGEDFRQFYPRWEQVEALRDPSLYSHFWRRVTEL